jgi:cyclopropane-fatty-acyl-phospholipid synthase
VLEQLGMTDAMALEEPNWSRTLPRVASALVERSLRRAGIGPCELELADGRVLRFGAGAPRFRLRVRTLRGLAALVLRDEMLIGEAYLDGHLDLDGDVMAALELRDAMHDRRPARFLWDNYVQALLFGQERKDAEWIAEHYDEDPEFYLTFLGAHRCYSHGYFTSDDETLDSATERKLATALAESGARPGARVLDIGAGWGAFTEYAGKRGVHVTSLTISRQSEHYVQALIDRERLPCRVLREHLLSHQPAAPYDAIVNLGVTEHLPDYAATLAQYERLLRPGARIFLDACAAPQRSFRSFVRRHIWPGNTTPLVLHEYVREVTRSRLALISVVDDRHSYHLTTRHWAERLERARSQIVARWGERQFRRFQVYLWGCAAGFHSRALDAFHWVLELQPHARASYARP